MYIIYLRRQIKKLQGKYQVAMTETTTEVIVPTADMLCNDNTLVILNGAVLNSGYTRAVNTYTFAFDLNDGDILVFKN
jgi:hypothetical protein